MKIISTFKDYYDYPQGVWVIDEHLILDRTKFYSTKIKPNHLDKISLYIGEYLIEGLYDKTKDKFVCGYDLFDYAVDFNDKRDSNNKNYWNNIISSTYNGSHKFIVIDKPDNKYSYYSHRCVVLLEPLYLGHKSPTYKEDCAVMLDRLNRFDEPDFIKNPILREYELQTFTGAEFVWQMISSFLGTQKTMQEKEVPVGNDKVRIKSYGFDTKTSFRNMKRE